MASIKKMGDGSYKITVSLGYDVYGKKIRRYTTWVPDKEYTPRQLEKEVNRQATLFEEACKTGQITKGGGIKLVDFIPQWIENAECRLVLHKNCRNTAEVFKTSCSILGLDNVTYNEIHGEVPAAKFYQTTAEMESIVSNFIKRVSAEGLQPEDIVILTAKTTDSTWIDVDKNYGGYELSYEREPDKVLFTTIRKFKGLEAEAILIVDVSMSALAVHESRRLLYVGASRAKNLLNIAMLEDVESDEMGNFLRTIAPERNVPKNKKGLKRILNVTV